MLRRLLRKCLNNKDIRTFITFKKEELKFFVVYFMAEAVIYKNVDEFLEAKRKEVRNPTTYRVSGIYIYHGEKNPFTGLFEIGENNKLIGEITDPNSICQRHAVKGEIVKYDDSIDMNFVKIPTGFILAPIYYSLKKKYDNKLSSDDELSGEYIGEWEFKEKVFKLRLNEEEFREIVEKILPEEGFTGYEQDTANKASLELFKI